MSRPAAPDAQARTFQRTIRSGYDDRNRLTSAQERGSTTNMYTYTNDRTGNRTDGRKTYDATNQVIGWTYAAAGNLVGGGTTTYAYDALNRFLRQRCCDESCTAPPPVLQSL